MNLILLPGLDGTGILFDNLVDQLKGKFHLTRVAYPSNILCSLDELAEIAKNKIPDPANSIILAESFSGLVALTLLEKLVSPPKGIIFGMCFVGLPFRPLLKVISKLPINHVCWSYVPDIFFRRLCLGNGVTAGGIECLRNALSQITVKVLRYRLKIALNFHVPDKPRYWKIPCGYIQATEDRLVTDSAVVWFSHNFKPFFLKEIHGPHFLFQVQAEECANYILWFKQYLDTKGEMVDSNTYREN